MEFKDFKKIPRWSREIFVTEKIDGTNASIFIGENGEFLTGSRNRWITPEDDNYGFSKWANEKKEELLHLGPGQHYGEWYGQKIQRTYGLSERKFALFNVDKWKENRPSCCELVPVLYNGVMSEYEILKALDSLRIDGSRAVPNYDNPEGIVIYHVAANSYFKKTLEKDESPKGKI